MSHDPWGNQQPGGTPPWQQPGAGGNPPWAQPGAGGAPPWAQPGAGGGLPPGRPPAKKNTGLVVAAVIVAVVAIGGIVGLVAMSGGDDDDDDTTSGTDRSDQTDDRSDDTDAGGSDTTSGGGSTGDGTFVLTVDVTHPFSGDLGVLLEVYTDDAELLCSSTLVEATGEPSDVQSVELDASDCADFYPPGPDQRWLVGVADLAAEDEGTLDSVELEGPDGDVYSADGLPALIPDDDPAGVAVELT